MRGLNVTEVTRERIPLHRSKHRRRHDFSLACSAFCQHFRTSLCISFSLNFLSLSPKHFSTCLHSWVMWVQKWRFPELICESKVCTVTAWWVLYNYSLCFPALTALCPQATLHLTNMKLNEDIAPFGKATHFELDEIFDLVILFTFFIMKLAWKESESPPMYLGE